MLKCRQCVPPATKTLGVSPTWPIVVFFGYERNTMIFSIGPFRTVKLKQAQPSLSLQLSSHRLVKLFLQQKIHKTMCAQISNSFALKVRFNSYKNSSNLTIQFRQSCFLGLAEGFNTNVFLQTEEKSFLHLRKAFGFKKPAPVPDETDQQVHHTTTTNHHFSNGRQNPVFN